MGLADGQREILLCADDDDTPEQRSRNSCTYFGVNDDTCSAKRSFCRIDNGDCKKKGASQSAYCDIKPKLCSYDFKPVCGCDMVSYATECTARFAGVNIMHLGECKDGKKLLM